MGVIHVLAGPDHLSALATLSGTNIREENNNYMHSFLLGIKWGLGHAVGLILVGGILIAIDVPVNNGKVSSTLEAFVGIFMLALGTYSMHKACRHRSTVAPSDWDIPLPNENLKRIKEHDSDEESGNHRDTIICEMTQVLNEDSDLKSSLRSRSSADGRAEEGRAEEVEYDDDVESRIFKAARCIGRMTEQIGNSVMTVPLNRLNSSIKSIGSAGSAGSGNGLLKKSPSQLLLERHEELLEDFGGGGSTHDDIVPTRSSCTTGSLAVLTGIVHGVAGPGGVLGIIPAVQLRDPYLSSVYLGTFCLTSCLVMGAFAAFYGSFSKWLAGGGDGSTNRVFIVEFGSASLSICVGLIWIILLSVGKLEDVFP
jgi:hypothetical protein